MSVVGRRTCFGIAASLVTLALSLGGVALAQEQSPTTVLFTNVRIFDGHSATLTSPTNVLVTGNKIEKITTDSIRTNRSAQTTIINGNGRTLMPGLIDAHVHLMFSGVSQIVAMTADIGYVELQAAQEAGRTLMRGFTSVRDAGGPTFGLKRAIDEGIVDGPRIYPSGAFISQTSGHGDFRLPYEIPRSPSAPLSYAEVVGVAAIADGADQVLLRTREQLMKGASQIKLMAGGGVSSNYDPLDVTQYSEAELRAAVGAAQDWGTYVLVHAYTPNAIQRAITAGVKCIDHGQLADEATARLMAENGIWWSLQPFLDDEDANPKQGPNRAKQLSDDGWNRHRLQARDKVQNQDCMGHRCHALFDPRIAARQNAILTEDGALVHARPGAENGDRRQRGIAGPFQVFAILIREAGPGRGRRSCRSPAGRWRSHRRYQTRRRPREELRRHHERRQDLQKSHHRRHYKPIVDPR